MEHTLLLIVLFFVLLAELVNGWTDAPNAIATVVSTRSLSPRVAVLMASALNIMGAFFGTAVAATIATGIVKTEAINLQTISATMIAVISWGVFAWQNGLPMSKS